MSTTKIKEPKIAMLESLRSIGYDFNSALADILDNSISAKAKNIDFQSPENMLRFFLVMTALLQPPPLIILLITRWICTAQPQCRTLVAK